MQIRIIHTDTHTYSCRHCYYSRVSALIESSRSATFASKNLVLPNFLQAHPDARAKFADAILAGELSGMPGRFSSAF